MAAERFKGKKMFRYALKDLEKWLKSPTRKPLVIRGARQVGKTWLVREFARLNNLNLIELNFELDPNQKSLFEENDPKKVLIALEVYMGQKINPENALLFLDEIQSFPKMLAKLRWFKELMPELPVVVAGSLLEFVLEKHEFSMPVGRISYLYLEPLSFDEYLYAQNQQLLNFLSNYNWQPIPDLIHTQALAHLRDYIVVGGLPAAIESWSTQQSLLEIHQIHQDIITTYREDFSRYKGRFDARYFDDVFNYIPKNIGNKIVYSHINRNAQVASLKAVFSLVAQARVIHRVHASSGNGVPLSAEINDKYNKSICLDVGLMNSILGINLNEFQMSSDINCINKGAISEQLVGQLLRTIEPYYIEPKLYYWQRNRPNSNAEVDYLIQHNTTVIPIEVKSGTRGNLQSLHFFMKLKKLSTAVRFNSDPPSKMVIDTKLSSGEKIKYQLLSLPMYLVGQTKRLLSTKN